RTIQVTAPVKSDLVVSNTVAPSSVNVGENFDVTYTIKNQGTDATPAGVTWSDAVYFSANAILGDGDDTFIQALPRPGGTTAVGANATYTASQTLKLPSAIGGSGYLIFVADS